MDALTVESLTHRYNGHTALSDVSLRVMPGELVCLLGPSGCGKTTLLRLIAGLETLQAGQIAIRGKPVATPQRQMPPEKRNVGLVFQDYALFPHLSVLENVRFGLARRGNGDPRERARQALAQVGMAGYCDSYPHALSGGQQQRVALARALAPQPGLMLLDEPFSGLDSQLRHKIRDDTLHVLKTAGTATLLVTHDPEEAMFLGDRIVLMRDGRLEQIGPPADIYCHPASAFAADFLGEVNTLAGTAQGGKVQTPVGKLDARGIPDGEPVDVLVRPEALQIATLQDGRPVNAAVAPAHLAGSDVRGTVMAARFLGRTSLIHVWVPDLEGGYLHLHARMPGQFLPEERSEVAIQLDRRQAFVFPRHGYRTPDLDLAEAF